MDQKLFKKYCDFIYRQSGIHLTDRKEALVEGRIAKRMRVLTIPTHEQYFDFVTSDAGKEEISRMLDTISTNVTHFYRESAHFDYLHNNLVTWAQGGQRSFTFWSAASSSGEEPYTMGIIAKEALSSFPGSDLRILATDISGPMLLRCSTAEYAEESLEKLPPALRNNWFSTIRQDGEKRYIVADEIRRLLTIKRLNLSKPPFPMKGPFDVVFIRNVMIYFDLSVKQQLISEAYRLLKPGGILCIGHSESLTGIKHNFKTEQPAAYRKPL